jgi:two-component system response regulator YesN
MVHRVLIADDEALVCGYLKRLLSSEPWEVEIVYDGRTAMERLNANTFDLVVLDLHMPPYNGLDILQEIQEKKLQTDVVVLTGYGSIEVAVDSMKVGAQDFLTKPVKPAEFLATVRRLLDQRRPLPHVLAGRLDEFTREHAGNAALKLADVCEHFRISERYVCRLFKEHGEASFRQRLGHYRIERAKGLLASTDISMFQVAERCGFKNQRRFTETFRREEGTTPRNYRENARSPARSSALLMG